MIQPNHGYIAYIVNPKSGAKRTRWIDNSLRQYFRERGFDVRILETLYLKHASELARQSAEAKNCCFIVAVGGDGTVREVAHGLAGSDKPLLILPCGTENMLANELGLVQRPKVLIKAFESGCTKTLDLGTVNNHCFTSVAGFGFDAAIVKIFHKTRKGYITHLDYVRPIWQVINNYKFEPLTVQIDGTEVFNDKGFVLVGNISTYTLGLKVHKKASYEDGLLDLCIYKCESKAQLFKHFLKTIVTQHISSRDVLYYQGKKIKVASESKSVYSQLDGDPGPELPVEIEVLPQSVKCMVPKNSKPAGILKRIFRIFW